MREPRSGKHKSRLVFSASRLSHLKQRKIKKNIWDQGRETKKPELKHNTNTADETFYPKGISAVQLGSL